MFNAMKLLRRPVKFQYASGFRLTKQSVNLTDITKFVNPVAPYLILNGDVGDPEANATKRFLTMCSLSFKTIWWIPGRLELNHVSHTEGEQIDKMFELANKIGPNIAVGCMSEFHIPNEDIVVLASSCFRSGGNFVEEDNEWLEEKLEEYADMKVVLATHDNRFDIQGECISAKTFMPISPFCKNIHNETSRNFGNNWFANDYSKTAVFEVGDSTPMAASYIKGSSNLRDVFLT